MLHEVARILRPGGRLVIVWANRRVRRAAELLRNAEVQADGLGVADVQIAVRLGRNARDDAVQPVGEIAANALTDEICKVFGHGGLLEPMLHMGIVRRQSRSAAPACSRVVVRRRSNRHHVLSSLQAPRD